MRNCILLLVFSSFSWTSFSQGTACSDAIPLTLNGTLNNYSTSSSTGANVLCANNGVTPITWFSFTSNASAESPLLDITAADGQPCEIAMYTSCSGNMNNNLETPSSMCFDDGTGLWAPAHNYAVMPNTTYYLRVKTATSTTLQVEGQSYTPANNTCSGATAVDENLLADNNATHKPATGINPPDLCAASIENTAYYQYNVAATGTSIINISSISCDNGAGNNISGFQIGFFTGNCGSLTWLNPCFSGSGSFVQATTPVLSAGTKVYVAIDGFEGSNCRYNIQAINAITLASEIKNFSGWKNKKSNLLKWESINALTKQFEVERSADGNSFTSIGRLINPSTNKKNDFEFEDRYPLRKGWYRLKEVLYNDEIRFSKTLRIIRLESNEQQLILTQTADLLTAQFQNNYYERAPLVIVNSLGQLVSRTFISCNKGSNSFSKNIAGLPPGNYFITLQTKNENFKAAFTKRIK
jgi:hypothetical protein